MRHSGEVEAMSRLGAADERILDTQASEVSPLGKIQEVTHLGGVVSQLHLPGVGSGAARLNGGANRAHLGTKGKSLHGEVRIERQRAGTVSKERKATNTSPRVQS